jgi:hypothetical protein
MVMLEEIFAGDLLPFAAAFLISFAVLFVLLNKSIFKENRASSAVIAGGISVLMIWGIVTKTELWFSFNDLFMGLGDSTRAIAFLAVLAGILILLWIGFKKSLARYDFPILWFAVAGALIFVFFLPNFISQYHLPEIIQNDNVRWASMIAGIVVAVWALFTKTIRLKVKESGGGKRTYTEK